jgi:hypothetical protein
MASAEPLYIRVSGTHTGATTNTETTLQLPQRSTGQGGDIWILRSFHYVRSGGAAANYRPRLGQAAGWTDDDINERMTYASTAVGTPISDVFTASIPCKSDSNGRLYFRPGFDGGSDNAGAYEFYFEHARGG